MPIFNPGLKLLLKAANTPLEPNPDHPIAYLHLVDGAGNTIVPEYELDGLRTSAGPVSGAKYTIVSTADLQALTDRIVALEAMLDGTGTITVQRLHARFISAIKANDSILTLQVPTAAENDYRDVIEIELDTAAMVPDEMLGFFGGRPVLRQAIPDPSKLLDTEDALIDTGLLARSAP